MGCIHHSAATFRLFGGELVPDEISLLLGAEPTKAFRKGEETVGKVTGKVRVEKTGSWRLSAARQEPENLEVQINEILEKLTTDLAIWKSLRSRFDIDIFCGLFMASSNDGFAISAELLAALGVRGIRLSFDIYDAQDD